MNIREIQAECKKRYPFGSIIKSPYDNCTYTLDEERGLYNIYSSKHIDAGNGKGYLYYNGEFAELISYPEWYISDEPIVKKDINYKYLIKYLKKLKIK